MDVVLVSSGAIVLGLGELKKRTRSVDLAFLQAAAAVGQTILMRVYSDLFKENKKTCAQILLTWDDFNNRDRFKNAKKTLQALFDYGAVPVINENDTIATDEIKFGDNDKLSALVASLAQADLLILLSDVDGLYKMTDGQKETLQEVREINEEIRGAAAGTNKKLFSKGGMRSKIEAVHIASHAKIPCIIANGSTPNVIARVMAGERIGTFFVEKDKKMLDRKHWISFGAKPKGVIVIDDGAKQALLDGGKSLLLPGVVSWEGYFKKDDVIVVYDKNHQEIARGITNYATATLESTTEKKGQREVIHRDNLVLCER